MKRCLQNALNLSLSLAVLLAAVTFCRTVNAADKLPLRDIVFAKPDGHELKLNIFLPERTKRKPPLVVFIHGGGWRKGSYKNCRTQWLTKHGFAVASIGYRLTHQAQYPAQLHDCKAAVRWLRANAGKYGYDVQRIGVTGTSAGGHLALMMGVTSGDKEQEGNTGDHLKQSSQVDAVVDYFGPSDFVMRSLNQPIKTEPKDAPVRLLLGAPASTNPELAKKASPAFHVTSQSPPLMILHGSNDKTVSVKQAERMAAAYQQKKQDVTLHIIPKAGHGSAAIFSPEMQQKVATFFQKHLTQK